MFRVAAQLALGRTGGGTRPHMARDLTDDRSQSPHPFGFAQGRLCLSKERRDKDEAPSPIVFALRFPKADSSRL
jgi:hypothetical protein